MMDHKARQDCLKEIDLLKVRYHILVMKSEFILYMHQYHEVVRFSIWTLIIFNLSKWWKAKFSILCDAIFLVRLQGKFDIDHSSSWMLAQPVFWTRGSQYEGWCSSITVSWWCTHHTIDLINHSKSFRARVTDQTFHFTDHSLTRSYILPTTYQCHITDPGINHITDHFHK